MTSTKRLICAVYIVVALLFCGQRANAAPGLLPYGGPNWANVAITGGTATLTSAVIPDLTTPRYLSAQIEVQSTAATVGTRKITIPVPDDLAGYLIADAGARVYTVGTTGTLGLSVYKRTTAGAEALAYTAAVTTGVIEASTGAGSAANRTLAAGDLIIVDVTSIHSGTASKGLGMWFKLSK